jgi:hypothetical protein
LQQQLFLVQINKHMSTLKASKIVPLSSSLIIDSTTTTVTNKLSAGGTAGDTPLAPLQVYGASTAHGADNRGTVLVSNTNNTRQLQIGVNDSSGVAWFQGWIPTSAGLTLAIQPSGGNVGIGTTTPTVALDVNGTVKGITLTASSGIVLGGATFAAPSGSAPIFPVRAWVRFTQATSGAAPAVASGASGNVSGIIRNGLGDFTINFATPLPAGYCVSGTATERGTDSSSAINPTSTLNAGHYGAHVGFYSDAAAGTTSCRIMVHNTDTNTTCDAAVCSLMFVG